MSPFKDPATDRRRFLFGGAALGAGALVAGCTGSGEDGSGASDLVAQGNTPDSRATGKTVTIGLSIPAADHGWMAAIGENARAQADAFGDVQLEAREGTNDVNEQISQVQTLINRNVDVLAILPSNGESLTEVAQEAMRAGIPVVNVDRIFASSLAYRTWVGGDNYGMGISAGNFIAERLQQQGKADNPVIVEVAGVDNLPLTQERSDGFKEALSSHNLEVTARQAAEFTPQSGREVMGQLLQAQPQIDAVWNHDDNQGTGVLAAIEQTGRTDEFFMVGGAGSQEMMQHIKSDDGPMAATVLYPPTMSASGIHLARLIGQSKKMSDLVERAVPSKVTLYSATVTKENVDQYMEVGF